MGISKQKIYPCVWYGGQALQAARFYASVIPGSRILDVARYGKSGAKVSRMPVGSVLTVTMSLGGSKVMLLNGKPVFRHSEAMSLVVECRGQAAVDRVWNGLSVGGRKSVCGWLKDRYGVSWQVVPEGMDRLFRGGSAASERAMAALIKMRKLDIGKLKEAFQGQ
jgi:predicted 3-demethylubiquinone-9 3-methyltransferase (glyoxalase superfamily)